MITSLQKARWPIFVTGLILIAIGGFGLLTNASWGSTFSSLSTIFGTTMSFAQVFITFPALPGVPANTGRSAPPAQAPLPPQQAYQPYAASIQAPQQF